MNRLFSGLHYKTYDDLYGNDTSRTMQNNKSKNPFNTDKLYVYFNAYNFRTKRFAPDKYILELEQKQNICNGTDRLMLGGYFRTNAKCELSLRKCYFSKKNVEFTKEMVGQLKLNENEQEILNKQNALYLDIFNV